MTAATGFFSNDYESARARLLALADRCAVNASSIRHTAARGVNGEALGVDLLQAGPVDAQNLLVIGSGTHGVEGFCGSACQLGLLATGLHTALPDDTCLLLVHALNPHGFSHVRRVNEHNVDINRNFVRPGVTPSRNENYDLLHEHLVPEQWFGESRTAADGAIREFIETHGERAYQAALTGGQYDHPNGIFYGGKAPCWSNLTWQSIVREWMVDRANVLFIDVHTGVGPYGYGEPILVDASYDDALALARSWLDDSVTSMHGEGCISAVVEGPISNPLRWHLGEQLFMAMSLEFGTRPVQQALDALRADNWLYLHDDVPDAQRRKIKAMIRDAFYVEETKWKTSVWERFEEVLTMSFDSFAHV